LIDWYNSGADGAIDWGSDGDFMQCVGVASDYMDDDQAKGFCNLRHQDAVGGPPGSEKSAAPILDFDMSGNQGEGRRCERCGGPLTRFEKGTLCTNCKVSDLAPTEKSIAVGAPLETGVVPFDLAGQAPTKCPQCGLTLDEDGLCPTHGTALKFNPSETRGRGGEWTSGGSDTAQAAKDAHEALKDSWAKEKLPKSPAGRAKLAELRNAQTVYANHGLVAIRVKGGFNVQGRGFISTSKALAETRGDAIKPPKFNKPPRPKPARGLSPISQPKPTVVPYKKMQADNLLAAVEAELLKRGINPLADA
jgi:uncharacterized Zn finger protein (UPF0148 family)